MVFLHNGKSSLFIRIKIKIKRKVVSIALAQIGKFCGFFVVQLLLTRKSPLKRYLVLDSLS